MEHLEQTSQQTGENSNNTKDSKRQKLTQQAVGLSHLDKGVASRTTAIASASTAGSLSSISPVIGSA